MHLQHGILTATVASLLTFGTAFADCGQCPEKTKADGATCTHKADHDHDSPAVARIDGRDVSRAELESRASAQLLRLDMQRAQVLESTLSQLIDERLLELEAESRELSVEALLASEIGSDVEIADHEVDAWYAANRARVRKPKEEVAGQIREMLAGQKLQAQRQELLIRLRSQHRVETLLEPFRVSFDAPDDDPAPSKGDAEAPVDVVVFSDFQCPYCRNVAPALEKVLSEREGKVRLQFRQFPLTSIHPRAMPAAEFSVCAQEQEKFWEFHDATFESFGELAVDQLMARAAAVGLDAAALQSCLDSGRARKTVERDLELGRAAGVSGTPAIYVEGRPVALQGGKPIEEQILTVVDEELRRLGP